MTEVGELLHEAGYDEDLVAAGLLHDAVERGSLTEARLRAEMDDGISALVLALTEDPEIASFAERKRALRRQVEAAGTRAITISPPTSSPTSAGSAVVSPPTGSRSKAAWERR